MTDSEASWTQAPISTDLDATDSLQACWGDATLALTGSVSAWGERDVVIVAGPDAISYLQGQASQDIAGLSVGQSRRTLVLSPQGRIDTWARVTRMADDVVWLDTDVGFGAQLEERLRRFLLRTKATITLSTMDQLMIRWPLGADAAIDGLAALGAGESSLSSQDPAGTVPRRVELAWPTIAGIDLLWPVGGGGDIGLADSVIPVDPSVLEALRIQAGIPAMGTELGEKTIPAEAPIIEQSVDFVKGCYTGQELVARVDSRGNRTPRRVWGLVLDTTMHASAFDFSTPLTRGGDPIGTVTSAVTVAPGAGYELASPSSVIGLASLGRDHGEGPIEIGGVTGRIVKLPVSDRH